jgi:hypothetical protein
VRLAAIAAGAEQIKAKSFTVDGEAVMPGPDGLSRFEELHGREAAYAAILYTFDLMSMTARIAQSPIPRLQGSAGTAVAQYPHCRGWADRVAGPVPRASVPRK